MKSKVLFSFLRSDIVNRMKGTAFVSDEYTYNGLTTVNDLADEKTTQES